MIQVEMFFDYTCPFCLKGHQDLVVLLPDYPQIEMVWKPCEAHPRPEEYGRHSDLCIMGMFYARDAGADLWQYHDLLYQAAIEKIVDIEDPKALSTYVGTLLDQDAFQEAITDGRYQQELLDGNDYAYQASGVWYLPAFRANGKTLDSAGGVGVSKQQLKDFLDSLV